MPIYKEEMKLKMSINELLVLRVKNNPKRVFIKSNDIEYTWEDVDKISQIIALDLKDLGVNDRSHVAICSENSVNWICTFFAINKLNATPVLLMPTLKDDEIVNASNLADIDYICYGAAFANEQKNEILDKIISNKNNKIKVFYDINKEIDYRSRYKELNYESKQYSTFIDNKNTESSKLFLFTSGSTGTPKVVMHSSETMVYRAYKYMEYLPLSADDKHCLVMPLFHMLALDTVLLCAMASNAQVIMPNNNKTSTVIEIVKNEKCTNLNVVPTMMTALICNKDFKKEDFSSIKLSIIAGSVSSVDQMETFAKTMPKNTFMNGYGLSESTPCASVIYKYGMDTKILKTVGKPYDGIELKIQNSNTNESCKQGETGEILVKGYGNMIGYYKLPKEEQTIDDEGWVHTGDLGYINEDDNLCLNGRIKDIIIRGGENIMPLEVSAVIEKSDNIKDIKVIGVPDSFRGEEIAACIVLKDGASFDENKMRLFMEHYISKSKIPKYFLIYDELPKLNNGKIDTIRLKKETIKRLNQN